MLSCIAAVAIATFVGKKTFEKNAFESNALLAQNVEALSQGDTGGGSSVCPGPDIYTFTGSFYGDTYARFHFADGLDLVYKHVTYTECYADYPNLGVHKSGFNGYADINFGETSYEPCEGWHFSPNF